MRSLFRFPAVLTRPVSVVLDTTVALLALPIRVVGLVASAERTLAAANEAVARTTALLERTDGIVQAASQAVTAAAATVKQVDTLTASAAPLLESYTEPLRRLEPTVRRMADTTNLQEVDALVTLIDRLPRLASAMDGDVIPLLGRIEQVGPDLNRLLDNVSDLSHMMDRMPKVFRRRRDNAADRT